MLYTAIEKIFMILRCIVNFVVGRYAIKRSDCNLNDGLEYEKNDPLNSDMTIKITGSTDTTENKKNDAGRQNERNRSKRVNESK